MARSWLVNSRGIARKVKNATKYSNYKIKDLGAEASRECPNCKHVIDNSDVSLEWPGLPAGVKFDPSDLELLEHLAGKVGMQRLHVLIDEFIPTLEDEQGICYTHPENLPGIKKDGSSVHFFHRASNAYSTGQRKRRKINTGSKVPDEHVRWHKTGKTKPVFQNGIQKGWKKIMVLYRSSKRASKPDKENWVMHQYHIGSEEDEKDGELVVSKIFYQHQSKQTDKGDMELLGEEVDEPAIRYSPRTPKTNTPQPPRPRKSAPDEHDNKHSLGPFPHQYDDDVLRLSASADQAKEQEITVDQANEEEITPAFLAGESQAIEEPDASHVDESLLCREVLDSFHPRELPSTQFEYTDLAHRRSDAINEYNSGGCGYSDLDDLAFDPPQDFSLADLQFGSQESITSWLDRL